MKDYCIPKELIPELKASIRNSQMNITDLKNATPEQRIAVFEVALGKEMAQNLEGSFQAAVKDNEVKAIKKWMQENLSEEYRQELIDRQQKNSLKSFLREKSSKKSDIVSIDKVLKMDETERNAFIEKHLDSKEDVEAFKQKVQDLEEKRTEFLGKDFDSIEDVNAFIEGNIAEISETLANINIPEKDIQELSDLARNFGELTTNLGENVGNLAEHFEANKEWALAYSDLEAKKLSLLPKNAWGTYMQTYGRANMLASIKSPFLNIESNTINGLVEMATRRFEQRQLVSDIDTKLKSQTVKNYVSLYTNTRVDFTRVLGSESFDNAFGKIAGEARGQVNNKYIDIVYNLSLQVPDVAAAAISFVDAASIYATTTAKRTGGNATDIFNDAVLLNPKTPEGLVIREQAIADAQRATGTNNSFSNQMSLGLRKFMNTYVPGSGDIMMPFVTTVANFAEAYADYAGLGFIKAGGKWSLYLGQKAFNKDGHVDPTVLNGWGKDVVRSGIGMTIALLLSSALDPEDFVGAFDPNRHKIEQLQNSTYNAIKIRNPITGEVLWINVDYLGPLSSPVVSNMYARKYGDGFFSSVGNYSLGMISTYLSQVPVSQTFGAFDALNLLASGEAGDTMGKKVSKWSGNLVGQFSSRLVPGIVYDLARGIDQYQRDTKRADTPIGRQFNEIIAKIPFLRHVLPEKTDTLGREMEESNFVSTLLFGARVREGRDDPITNEIMRLDAEGLTPNIKDMRYMYSTNVISLREQVGSDKFFDISLELARNTGKEYDKAISSSSYKKKTDIQKQKELSDISTKQYEKIMKKYLKKTKK